MRCDICIPAYNEAQILETSTKQVLKFCENNLASLDWSIVLVLNGSTDNSPAMAQAITKLNPKIKLIIFEKPGRGQALKKYWQQTTADILCYMDSDLAVELEALPKLLKPLFEDQADLVIGNRYHKLSTIKRSLLRESSSRFYNFIARIILGHKQKDLQCGFKAITKKAFEQLAPLLNDQNWFFDTELVVWAEKLNLKILDIPVNWHEIRLGKRTSKVKLFSATIDFLKHLLKLKQQLNKTAK